MAVVDLFSGFNTLMGGLLVEPDEAGECLLPPAPGGGDRLYRSGATGSKMSAIDRDPGASVVMT
jgi:hypothetical protein